MGSHVMYVGEVVEARRLSDKAPITYDYTAMSQERRKLRRARPARQTMLAKSSHGSARFAVTSTKAKTFHPISSAQFANTAPKISSPCTQNEHGSEEIQAAAATPCRNHKSKGVMNMEPNGSAAYAVTSTKAPSLREYPYATLRQARSRSSKVSRRSPLSTNMASTPKP